MYERLENVNAIYGQIQNPKQSTENIKYCENLKNVNLEIWNVEDELREYERNQTFNNDFITKARSVYILNDKRAAIKKHINNKYNSEITEEKSYSIY